MTVLFADAGIVNNLDLVEVNPILDREHRTWQLMVELAASLLGKSMIQPLGCTLVTHGRQGPWLR